MNATNKVNKKTGDFICGGTGKKGCGCDVGLGVIIKGIVYCGKCASKLRGNK